MQGIKVLMSGISKKFFPCNEKLYIIKIEINEKLKLAYFDKAKKWFNQVFTDYFLNCNYFAWVKWEKWTLRYILFLNRNFKRVLCFRYKFYQSSIRFYQILLKLSTILSKFYDILSKFFRFYESFIRFYQSFIRFYQHFIRFYQSIKVEWDSIKVLKLNEMLSQY